VKTPTGSTTGSAKKIDPNPAMRTTIIIPAYNEELTVGRTILDFNAAAPDAAICVVNNNSTDGTADAVRAAFAEIRARRAKNTASGDAGAAAAGDLVLLFEPRKGKSNAMRAAFAAVDADCCVMVDADTTYAGSDLPALLKAFRDTGADMVVGDRHSSGDYGDKNTRPMHGFGNNLVRALINLLFNARLRDILSGYRVFSRRYVKTFPILSGGFELEVEMTMHALSTRLLLVEVPVSYRERPPNSVPKLNTVADGFKVLLKIFNIVRYSRPLLFFGAFAAVFLAAGLAAGALPVWEFLSNDDHKITHFPTAFLAVGLVLCGVLSFAIAVILDTLANLDRKLAETRLLALGANPTPRDA
jgi:glycosyltransferase involved in cell wall biosynthesis